MEEIHKLRAQISNIVQTNFPDVQTGFEANLRPPNALQLKVLRQLIAAGFIDQVAVRKDIAQKGRTEGAGTQYTTSRGVGSPGSRLAPVSSVIGVLLWPTR